MRIDQPEEGYYRHRLRSGGVVVGVRIFFAPPVDPHTGDIMDRSPRWQAEVNGRVEEYFDRVWPQCTGEPIDEAEYRYLTERARWARDNDPNDAFATPRERVDWLNSTPAV